MALAGGGAVAAPPGPATVPGLRLPSMGLLDAQGLREAIGRSGLFAEAMLASSSPAAVAGDVKLALQALPIFREFTAAHEASKNGLAVVAIG